VSQGADITPVRNGRIEGRILLGGSNQASETGFEFSLQISMTIGSDDGVSVTSIFSHDIILSGWGRAALR